MIAPALFLSQFVLKDPMVDFMVLECARGGILKGLVFQNCDVAVVSNISAEFIGQAVVRHDGANGQCNCGAKPFSDNMPSRTLMTTHLPCKNRSCNINIALSAWMRITRINGALVRKVVMLLF